MRLLRSWAILAPALGADVHAAIVEKPGGPVAMPTDEIDWKQAALSNVGPDAERPAEARVKELWKQRHPIIGDTRLPFEVGGGVPDALRSRHYYLISSTGVAEIAPVSLAGTIEYGFEWNAARLKTVRYFGDLILRRPDGQQAEGGFVLTSDQPLEFRTQTLAATTVQSSRENGLMTFKDGSPARQARFTWHSYDEDPQHVVRVEVTTLGEEYLFVQWVPSTTDCAFSFTLMRLQGSAMSEAGSSGYHCDI